VRVEVDRVDEARAAPVCGLSDGVDELGGVRLGVDGHDLSRLDVGAGGHGQLGEPQEQRVVHAARLPQ
jgi:hypothetical protein